MKIYTGRHQQYCGVDLHARTLYLCVLDNRGYALLEKNIKCDPALFLEAVAPYREDLVVAVACMFTWYWLADLCSHRQRESKSSRIGTADRARWLKTKSKDLVTGYFCPRCGEA